MTCSMAWHIVGCVAAYHLEMKLLLKLRCIDMTLWKKVVLPMTSRMTAVAGKMTLLSCSVFL